MHTANRLTYWMYPSLVLFFLLMSIPMIFATETTLSWYPDPNAEEYVIHFSKDYDFRSITYVFETQEPTITEDVIDGIYFVRVAGRRNQFMGQWSEPRMIVVKGEQQEEMAEELEDPLVRSNYWYYLGCCYYYLDYPQVAKAYFDDALRLTNDFEVPSIGPVIRTRIGSRIYEVCSPKTYMLSRQVREIFRGYHQRAQTLLLQQKPYFAYEVYLNLLELNPFDLVAYRQVRWMLEREEPESEGESTLDDSPELGGASSN